MFPRRIEKKASFEKEVNLAQEKKLMNLVGKKKYFSRIISFVIGKHTKIFISVRFRRPT